MDQANTEPGPASERYARQIILPEVGIQGQECLAKSKVLIIGAGGLGSPAAFYLTAAGVGTIGIADSDKVELSNLHRQILHSNQSLGTLKAESAKKTLGSLNPEVNVICYNERITEANIKEIINEKKYEFIIDAADNFVTKFLINDACVMLKKPFSHGEILGFKGQLMTYVPDKGPCYRCVFEEAPPQGTIPSGKNAGVMGFIPGIIGATQAAEAIKFLLNAGSLLNGFVLDFDALSMEWRKIKMARNKNCHICGN